ncbi:conserved hypothetical protein [Nostocoides japonicum T1-X7]|uniref:Uncharacterized protein n=1 Tax=Nostocoides japonicum T1-X7 TaxID=1194083 RepID=A0A077M2C1_9MICO|nr:conserved hypothetical protein [Tetrasphaera japonica T1-X7]
MSAAEEPVLPVFQAPANEAAQRDLAVSDEATGDGWAAPGPDGKGPEGWEVKGNTASRTFHTPESPWYRRTKAEVWFRDAEAAVAAGFTDALERTKTDFDEKDGKGEP